VQDSDILEKAAFLHKDQGVLVVGFLRGGGKGGASIDGGDGEVANRRGSWQ